MKIHGAALDPAKRYTAAIPDFLLKGGDAYSMFVGRDVLIDPESGDLFVTALRRLHSSPTRRSLRASRDGLPSSAERFAGPGDRRPRRLLAHDLVDTESEQERDDEKP